MTTDTTRSLIEKLKNHIRHLEKNPNFDFEAAFGADPREISDSSRQAERLEKVMVCDGFAALSLENQLRVEAVAAYLRTTEPVSIDNKYMEEMLVKHADRADMFQPDTEVIETRWVKLMKAAVHHG